MDFLTELSSSHPLLLSRMEGMTQPVTTPGSVELAYKLEELSGLASQIVRCSDELRAVSQGDFPGDSAAVFALLPVALSSAHNCLSVLEFITGQTSISPLPSSHFIPPPSGPLVHSPIPTPVPIKLDRSVSSAEPRRKECTTIKSRVDSPIVDPRGSTWGPFSPAVGTSHLPANSLGLTFLSRPTTPATQRWPLHLPPARTVFESAIRSTLGGRSDNERSPSSPLLSYMTPTRHGISIAELVDEEDSSPGTRGGTNASRSPGTSGNMSWASYPPLSIHFYDATPQDRPETPGVSQPESLRSSSPAPPETPELPIAHAPDPPHSPPVPPASRNNRHASGEGVKSPHRSKRKAASPATPEIPEGRMTRSSAKRKVVENSEMRTELSKRAKTGSP